MVYQHETGTPVRIGTVAGEELPFYRFTEIREESVIGLATGKLPIAGVTLATLDAYKRIEDGTTQKKE